MRGNRCSCSIACSPNWEPLRRACKVTCASSEANRRWRSFCRSISARSRNDISMYASAWRSVRSGKWFAASRKAAPISAYAGTPSTCAACGPCRYHRDHLAVVVHPAHPLAGTRSVSFVDTIDYEHVDIVARSIMQATQRSAAAAAGKQMRYRIQVSTVDAAYRIVAANWLWRSCRVRRRARFSRRSDSKVVPLSNAWARRQFVISVRDTALSVPAQLLVDSLRKSASKPERLSARGHRI